MKLTAKELKRQARESLTGRYGIPMAAFVLVELITLVINFPFNLSFQSNPGAFQIAIFLLASLIIALLSTILNCGLIYIHLNLSRKKVVRLSDIFYFFTRRPDRIILAELMLTGILLLAAAPAIIFSAISFLMDTALFYIITVIVWVLTFALLLFLSLQYHLIHYLLIEQPEEGSLGIMRQSRRLMSGNKGRALYISLSFIGMTLLSLFTLGIGLLWLNPYMNQTQTKFYQNIIKEI